MYAKSEKPKENSSRAAANSFVQNRPNTQDFGFVDNRPESVAQRKLQESINKGKTSLLQSSPHTSACECGTCTGALQLKESQIAQATSNVLQLVISDDNKCAVCLEGDPRDGDRTLPCGHEFHNDCLTPWLAGHDTCPVCRANVETGEQQVIEEQEELPQWVLDDVVLGPGHDDGGNDDEDEYNEHGQVRPAGGMFFMDL